MPLEPRRFAIQTLLQFCGQTCEECSKQLRGTERPKSAEGKRLASRAELHRNDRLRYLLQFEWTGGSPSYSPRAVAEELHSLEVAHRGHSLAVQPISATSAAMIYVWEPVAEPMVRRG
jgi:hypothetical protein